MLSPYRLLALSTIGSASATAARTSAPNRTSATVVLMQEKRKEEEEEEEDCSRAKGCTVRRVMLMPFACFRNQSSRIIMMARKGAGRCGKGKIRSNEASNEVLI